jgi:DNA-binding beta-propeller fold protein YncE
VVGLAVALLLSACGDDGEARRTSTASGPQPSPTPTRAPRSLGPGLGNLTYREQELFKPAGVIVSPRGHGNAAMVGGYLMVIYSSDGGGNSSNGGFDLWDISNPRQPVLFKRYDDSNTHALREAHGFAFSTSYPMDVLAVQTVEGMQFWDVTDPADFKLLSNLDLPHINGGDYAGIWWVFFQAPYVYAAGTGEGLYIIDAHDPTRPQLANWIPTSELAGLSPAQVFALGNLLVLVEHEGAKIVTLDISDPIQPRLLASALGGFGYSHLFAGGKVLTSGGPQLESVLPVLQGMEPIPAPRTMGVTDIGHDGSIAFRYHGSDSGGLDQGGYGSVQDGYFISGFSKQVAKFDIASGELLGTGTAGIHDSDEDFGLVLGNLIWGGNDHNGGSALFPHQTDPDTAGPEVTWVHPADGASQQSVTSRIGVSMSDQVDIYSVDATTFRVAALGQPPLPGKYSMQMGLVNFAPEQPLQIDTVYEVVVDGIRDLAGNPGGRFRSTFRTGRDARPLCRMANADVGLPIARTHETVRLEPVEVSGGTNLRYLWSFGDGVETQTTSPAVEHIYTLPGRHTVVLTVMDERGRSSCSAVQIVSNPPAAGSASVSATIAYSAGRVFNVNADTDTVTAIDAERLTKLWEVEVGKHPRTLAVAPDGRLWVASQDDATVSVLRPDNGDVQATIALPFASQPYGVAAAPDGSAIYVTLQATREALKLDPAGNLLARLPLDGKPRGIAVSADSQRLWVTRFLSDAERGVVWSIDADSFASATAIDLHFDAGPDTEESGRGVPNYLSSLAISPDGRRALVPSKKDNVARGLFRDGEELTFENRVRTIVSQIDLDSGSELATARVDLNDRDMAQAAVFSPHGDIYFVATQGTNTIEVVDTYRSRTIASIVAKQFEEVEGLGRRVRNLAPQGLAIDPQGTRLFVQNFLSRSIAVYDVEALVRGVRSSAPQIKDIRAIGRELLTARVLLGKRVFYNASDPRMSRDGYLSCASCHVDGTHDGQVWDFTQVGEGLRNTIDLTGRAGMGHGNVHWTANFDEIQDFENDIREQFSGTGFMKDADYAATRDPLGPPKAGKTGDLEALVTYLGTLNRFPDSPYRNPDRSLTAEGLRGKQVFRDAGCGDCHSGSNFTDTTRHDVGTLLPASGLGIGQPLSGVGIETPTLKGIWNTAPYLHHGMAASLDEVLDNPAHTGGQPLSNTQRRELVEYLLQIDDNEGVN